MAFTGKATVYEHLLSIRDNGAGFFVLMDPDRAKADDLAAQAHMCEDSGVDALLVGSSLMMASTFDSAVNAIAEAVSIPVILFPGESAQVSEHADAILFMSLLSGRNPEFIIGEQVRSAPRIRRSGLEVISTAYLLVESGVMTSVEFMSHTKPMPSAKPDIAAAHAIAAEMFGMKCVYLEAGSGAKNPVPDDMIRAVTHEVDIPVIVGGGIRSPKTAAAKVEAGASFIVVGNHLEGKESAKELEAFVKAVHG
jgi:putative glycerol-1-phosphate prenyltransferase